MTGQWEGQVGGTSEGIVGGTGGRDRCEGQVGGKGEGASVKERRRD